MRQLSCCPTNWLKITWGVNKKNSTGKIVLFHIYWQYSIKLTIIQNYINMFSIPRNSSSDWPHQIAQLTIHIQNSFIIYLVVFLLGIIFNLNGFSIFICWHLLLCCSVCRCIAKSMSHCCCLFNILPKSINCWTSDSFFIF